MDTISRFSKNLLFLNHTLTDFKFIKFIFTIKQNGLKIFSKNKKQTTEKIIVPIKYDSPTDFIYF